MSYMSNRDFTLCFVYATSPGLSVENTNTNRIFGISKDSVCKFTKILIQSIRVVYISNKVPPTGVQVAVVTPISKFSVNVNSQGVGRNMSISTTKSKWSPLPAMSNQIRLVNKVAIVREVGGTKVLSAHNNMVHYVKILLNHKEMLEYFFGISI